MWISEEPWISPWTENLSTDLSTAPGESASLINIIHRLDYYGPSAMRKNNNQYYCYYLMLVVAVVQAVGNRQSIW